MNIAFGADIGGTEIKIGVFAEDCKLIRKWAMKTDLSNNGYKIIPSVAESVSNYISENEISVDEVLGIGMGIPGPVDGNGYVKKCVNLNWNDFHPVEELRRFFPKIPVKACNDANAAALGEYAQGAGLNASSMMMVTLGTGVGGGVILDGKILTGAHGIAGEVGHIATNYRERENCTCGNRGCVDQCASATGIVREAKRKLEESKSPSMMREIKKLSAKDVCDCAKRGDDLAISTITVCMYPLGVALAHFSHAFDPEVYVIGGGVSLAGDIILTPIRKGYQDHLHLISKGADIRLARLGNDAGITGACALFTRRHAEKPAEKSDRRFTKNENCL